MKLPSVYSSRPLLVLLLTCLLVSLHCHVISSSFADPEVLHESRNATLVFLDWLRENNMTEVLPPYNRVSVFLPDVLGEERGLIATIPIAKGDVMVKIPFSLTLELEEDDPSPYPGADWRVILTAKLLREMALGEDSRWKSYLDILPQHHLIPWMDLHSNELPEVQYDPTIRRIADLQTEAVESYMSSDPEIIANATWEAFGWALTMVWNHAFSLYAPLREGSDEGRWRHMLIPVADLLNHHQEPNTDWREDGIFSDHIELIATKHIPAGTPALADYGDLTTEAMFLFYGFVTSRNPRDATILFYSLAEAVEWYVKRYNKAHRKSTEIPEEEFEVYIDRAKEGALRQLRYAGRTDVLNQLDAVGPEYIDPHDNTHGGAIVLYPKGIVDARLIGAYAMLAWELNGVSWDASEDEWQIEVEDAFVSVSRRCLELLETYKTTVTTDRKRLMMSRRKRRKINCDINFEECQILHHKEALTDLTIQYRIVKKMYLEELVHQYPVDYNHDEL